MTRVFAQQIHYARVTEGWIGVLRVWARAVVDLLVTAPGEHLQDDKLVPSPVGVGDWPASLPAGQLRGRWVVLGSLPLWIAAFLLLAAPNYMNAMFLNPPAILGLPAGVALLAIAGLSAGIGFLAIVINSSSLARTLAFLLLTCPASAVLLFGPAFVLVMLNLTT